MRNAKCVKLEEGSGLSQQAQRSRFYEINGKSMKCSPKFPMKGG